VRATARPYCLRQPKKEGAVSITVSRLLVIALAVLFTGCTINVGPGVRGSGNTVKETRDVTGFDEIVVGGSGDVTVEVTGTESLDVEAEDNILPLLTTEVVGGRLELGSTGSFTTTRGIHYTITAATLTGVTIRGSGSVVADGVDADSFAVRIEGSGDVTPTGTAASLTVQIDGSGNVNAFDLEATTVDVEINGSGSASVYAIQALDVQINGSGDVAYDGDPAVDESINGSGDVRRR
jgi:Putative auto-transporter adhesin, head GIN domain